MLRLLVASVALLSIGGAAQAATSLTFTSASIGQTQSVDFAGFTSSFAGGTTALPGLSAKLDLRLTAISGNTWTFSYGVANTSSAPVTSSRVSVFGFNVSNMLNSASATGEFSSVGSGNVPVGRGRRDVCFRTGGGGQCSGGGGAGVSIGEALSAGTVKLIFKAPTTNVVLSELFVRYQSLNAPSQHITGGSGVGDVVGGTVPEPTTWAMLIIGFGAIGGAMRRSRTAVAA